MKKILTVPLLGAVMLILVGVLIGTITIRPAKAQLNSSPASVFGFPRQSDLWKYQLNLDDYGSFDTDGAGKGNGYLFEVKENNNRLPVVVQWSYPSTGGELNLWRKESNGLYYKVLKIWNDSGYSKIHDLEPGFILEAGWYAIQIDISPQRWDNSVALIGYLAYP